MVGKRRREGAGVTAAQALEAQRRKRHELEGRELGVRGFDSAGETTKKPPLHVAVKNYLEQVEALKKPNTHRKYEAVLERFLEFFRERDSIDAISGDDLTGFVVTLKKEHGLGSNTILHNAVIIAQFLKRHGRSGTTREPALPERITPLVKVYRHDELARFFAACSDRERALFATFLLTGFREQEVMYLFWSDVNFELRTVRVTAKPELGFYPKRWEDRRFRPQWNSSKNFASIRIARTASLCSHPLLETANSICSITANPSPRAPDSIRRTLI